MRARGSNGTFVNSVSSVAEPSAIEIHLFLCLEISYA